MAAVAETMVTVWHLQMVFVESYIEPYVTPPDFCV